MLQVIQYQKNGKLSIEELPAPQLKDGHVLVQNVCSVVSVGTERTSVATAQASMIGKARSRPDLVKQVMGNAQREGVRATYAKVKNRLDNYKELGYSSAGVVLESAVDAFVPGARVACAGSAFHAEIISVPKHFVSRIPGKVEFEDAAFTTLGAIAMQGVRQANVHLGESVAVIGLGLIGLITVQLLKANGCRVIGLDLTNGNFPLAKTLGCDACLKSEIGATPKIDAWTNGRGVDATIITAGTKSNDPVELACAIARKKGRIVVVGSVGMNIPRSGFYEKELEFTIATSYGPGRYDQQYELKGIDYPIGHVRWTLNRNMEAVLDLMERGALSMSKLVTHRFPIGEGLKAYDLITGKKTSKYIGIVIGYPAAPKSQVQIKRIESATIVKTKSGRPGIGFIGAGNFAQSYLLPHLKNSGVALRGVATTSPVTAQSVGRKFSFGFIATDPKEILKDKETSAVVIATRHDSHARYVVEALQNGKHVFVEKPVAISLKEIDALKKVRSKRKDLIVTAGFNRRYSKQFRDMFDFLSESGEPMTITYRVNAGVLPTNHWMNDPAHGGRIVGEACHFVDCMQFLTGARPAKVFAVALPSSKHQQGSHENVNAAIRFEDGSIGNLTYLSNGDPAVGKEYCEVHRGGMTAIMKNFDEVIFSRNGNRKRKGYDGGKGHAEEMKQFVLAVQGANGAVIPFDSVCETTEVTFRILESIQRGIPIDL